MKFIKGQNRTQSFLFPVSLEQSISLDNEVRVIDIFVESLSLKDFGFDMDFIENGRPAYHPSDLLKLFIYGYLNKIRSSRELEKECKRNIEVMWLLKGLVPDHNTISNFRRDNPKSMYILRRIINILGKDVFSKYLNILVSYILNIFVQIRLILKRSAEFIYFQYFSKLNFYYCLNRLIFGQNLNKGRGF
jgi:transposase